MKRVFALLAVLALLLTSVPFSAFAAEDGSPKHIPRIVSVVFDNSGSMYCQTRTVTENGRPKEEVVKQLDRWAYANYAMQAFTALMSAEDELYVTYMNDPGGSIAKEATVRLENKKSELSSIGNIAFGGGTPNVIGRATERLIGNKQSGAEHFLVVMADGELNSNLNTTMQAELEKAKASLDSGMGGESYQIIYFSMSENDKTSVSGVDRRDASGGTEIIRELREVSKTVMGRTEINTKLSGNKVSFSLSYPALSVAVFMQKTNGSFSPSSAVKVLKDGRNASFRIDRYALETPDRLTKNQAGLSWGEDKAGVTPTNPPAGLVALVTNGDSIIGKGSYTIELPETVKKDDLVVMVEPAVRLQCDYKLNGEKMPLDKVKENIRKGDKLEIECGLFEIDENGNIGNAVPESVLRPTYRVRVGETAVNGNGNTFAVPVDTLAEEHLLRVEAVIEGYQPFADQTTFDYIAERIVSSSEAFDVSLTKENWKAWHNGEGGITFKLNTADAVRDTTIRVDGLNGLPSGACATLGDTVYMKGTDLVYVPKGIGNTAFASLPAGFSVTLVDRDGKTISTAKVTTVQPQYKLEIKNELEGASLGLEMLKTNSKGLGFTLTADYDGSGQFRPVTENGCEEDVTFTCESGVMTGKTEETFGSFRFVPQYDEATNTDVNPADILGRPHSITVKASVDGKEVASESVSMAVNVPTYKVITDNPITEAFTLDSIKNNACKIVFSLQADYKNDGSFTTIADWDLGVYDKLMIDTGELPGTFATEYDAGGKPIGKSFVPLYDENNNNGVVFTKVAGKTHTIAAVIEEYALRAETTVEVQAPVYEVAVRKDKIVKTTGGLCGNRDGVEFTVIRDNRPLTYEELKALNYTAGYDPGGWWWLDLRSEVCEENGEAFIRAIPVCTAWWLFSFVLGQGDASVAFTVGEAAANAVVGVIIDPWLIGILLIFAALIAISIYLIVCYKTLVRIVEGTFYAIDFKMDDEETCRVHMVTPSDSRDTWRESLKSGEAVRIGALQTKEIVVGDVVMKFTATKAYVSDGRKKGTLPQYSSDHKGVIETELPDAALTKLADGAMQFTFLSDMTGYPADSSSKMMGDGVCLVHNGRSGVVFVTREKEQELLDRLNETNTDGYGVSDDSFGGGLFSAGDGSADNDEDGGFFGGFGDDASSSEDDQDSFGGGLFD